MLTFTWYQVAVMGTEGAFWGLAAANFLSRLATKPVTIVASALVVFLVNRRLTRPVVSPDRTPAPGVSARGQAGGPPLLPIIL